MEYSHKRPPEDISRACFFARVDQPPKGQGAWPTDFAAVAVNTAPWGTFSDPSGSLANAASLGSKSFGSRLMT
jgi:hypothetical protein